jgi:O-antigen ligase
MISLFATVTRGAYLAVVSGIGFIAIVRNRRILIPLIVAMVLVIVFAPPYMESRIKSIFDPHHPENVSRIELWKTGIRVFKDHPLVGAGDIDYGTLIDRYADPGLPREWGHFHNTPIQILVNYGILGFAALMVLFVKMFSTEWKIFRRVRNDWFTGSFALGSLAALIGFFVMGLTEWSFGDQEVVTLIWTTLGIVLSMGTTKTSPAISL